MIHGYSFGLAIDLASAVDIRVCTADAKMCVKEVDIGIAADVGSLSRLPKVVGNFGWVKDVCLSARVFGAAEAERVGFVSYVEKSKAEALTKATQLAEVLATKSPVAVQGTKDILNHARDHTIADSECFPRSFWVAYKCADMLSNRLEIYWDLECGGYSDTGCQAGSAFRNPETDPYIREALMQSDSSAL